MSNLIQINLSEINKTYLVNDIEKKLISTFFRKQKKVPAIKNINLKINAGESVALLGPNGAGKSTLIKIMTGIILPDSGSITCLGLNPRQSRYEYTQQIGVVMGQKSLLHSDLPAIDSFNLFGRIYGLDKKQINNQINFYKDLFQIQNFINTPIRQLSLGQRMQCEIIASLLHKPKIAFLDEPTIGLDLFAKFKLLDFLKQLRKELNLTIILATHSLQEVESISDRVVVLNEGRKVFDNSVIELRNLKKYRTITFTTSNPDLSLKKMFSTYNLDLQIGNNSVVVSEEEYKQVASTLINNPTVNDFFVNAPSLDESLGEILKNATT